MQDAQDMLQHTLLIERETDRLLTTASFDTLRSSLKLINEHEALQRFHAKLQNQAAALVAVARTQSGHFTRDYRDAVQRLVETSNRNQHYLWYRFCSFYAGSSAFPAIHLYPRGKPCITRSSAMRKSAPMY